MVLYQLWQIRQFDSAEELTSWSTILPRRFWTSPLMPFSAIIRVVVDARSQFVAFASSSIERCGVASAAKSLSHNRALCESFGRVWVTGCLYQVGTTATAAEVRRGAVASTDGEEEGVHVFMGLSATLGVVWSTCPAARGLVLGDGTSAGVDRVAACLGNTNNHNNNNNGNGGGRFVAASTCMATVLDAAGKAVTVLADTEGDEMNWYPEGFWVGNGRWLVFVGHPVLHTRLFVWRMMDGGGVGGGVPVGAGVRVKLCVPLNRKGAGFSRFNPCSDELVFVGGECPKGSEGEGAKGEGAASEAAAVSFVNLERSIDTGITVESKKRVLLPYSYPLGLAWESPDTILTLHNDTIANNFKVYNIKSGEMHTFLYDNYAGIYSVPPGSHIVACLSDVHTKYEIYCASNLSQPSSWICGGGDPGSISLKGINIVPAERITAPGAEVTAEIHDAFTQKCIACSDKQATMCEPGGTE
ncbi:hypothetical protein Pelo_18036 [Pelomyxa schiedti]|nr:hypothetical protein Pelo_18036 [Pelomyxa schiedti]